MELFWGVPLLLNRCCCLASGLQLALEPAAEGGDDPGDALWRGLELSRAAAGAVAAQNSLPAYSTIELAACSCKLANIHGW